MSIYIKSISGFNFAGYSNIMINLNENITYLIGPNGAGKTIAGLDIVWFVMQGIAEKSSEGKIPLLGDRFRFIGSEGATALAELVLYDNKRGHDVRVIRKLLKHGTELTFSAPAGIELDQPWLNDLFNIFLISPKRFIDLSSRDQATALGINTKVWDDEIAKLKLKFTEINKELDKYDNLAEVELVKRPPLEALQLDKAGIKEKLNKLLLENQAVNKGKRDAWQQEKQKLDLELAEHNRQRTEALVKYNACSDAASILRLHGAGEYVPVPFPDDQHYLDVFLAFMKAKILPVAVIQYPDEPEYIDELPDDAEMVAIDEKIMLAAGENERALLYEQYVEKLEKKGQLELQLQQNKNDQALQYGKRLDYIKAFEFPFSKLSVDDEGGLLLEDKPLKPAYFSSGELIRIIPSLIASRNPEFKYVFIQEANLIDEVNLQKIEKELTSQGFQLVFEFVGKEKLQDKNCIMLRNRKVIADIPAGKFIQTAKGPVAITSPEKTSDNE